MNLANFRLFKLICLKLICLICMFCSSLFCVSLSTEMAFAQNEGQAKLDEAMDRKIDAKSPSDLEKVIKLSEEAIEAGLDEGNSAMAKKLVAAAAMQKAKAAYQALRGQQNQNAIRMGRRRIVQDLERVIENAPDTGEAYLMMAQMEALPGGSREEVVDNIKKAIENLGDDPEKLSEAHVMRALTRDNDDDRLKDLSKAVETNPENVAAWQAKMGLQSQLGLAQETLDDAERLLDKDDSNLPAFGAAIDSLLRLDRGDDAISMLTEQIEKKPEEGMFYRVRARAHLSQDDDSSALEDLNKALELNKRDAQSLILRGQVYYDMGEVAKANRDISDALLIQPNSVEGVLMRSLVAAREERYAAAISDMELLVRFNPANNAWVMQLSSYYQMDDRPRKAISILDELMRRDPDEWRALRLRGDAKLAISEHDSAIEDYEQAIKVLERQRSEAGTEITNDSLALDEDYSGALNNLAWVLSTSPEDELRDGERSVELGLKACEVTEYAKAHILSTLAAGYAEVGDFEKARKWAAEAVKLGEEQGNEQLDQLKLELESYKEEKPWRETQETEENESPLTSATETIDT